ncbi:hypothetical protein ACFW1F_34555, partial [Streptomyces bungoensis]
MGQRVAPAIEVGVDVGVPPGLAESVTGGVVAALREVAVEVAVAEWVGGGCEVAPALPVAVGGTEVCVVPFRPGCRVVADDRGVGPAVPSGVRDGPGAGAGLMTGRGGGALGRSPAGACGHSSSPSPI